jgi:hypothetical protein
MFPAEVPEAFEREQGSTEAEWLAVLPGAVRAHALQLHAGQASVAIGEGRLLLNWQVMPPRRIALIRMPRLSVRYRFEGVDATTRAAFMRYFDLFIQRGGG